MFVKKPNNQVQSTGIKSSQMLNDLAPRAVQREKQHANWTKRTFGIESEVKDTQTPITKKSNDQNTRDTDGKTVLRKAIAFFGKQHNISIEIKC